MRGFALTETDALPLLQAWNQTHCQPPWTDTELRHKLRSAAQSTRPLGYLIQDRPNHKPNEIETESERKARLRKDWPRLQRFTLLGIEAVARIRHILPDAVDLAHHYGFLKGAMIDGHPSYVLTEGHFAQARRLDGQPFQRRDGTLIKAKNLPGSEAAFIGQSWLASTTHVLLVEGAIGLIEALAAFTLVNMDAPWGILAATSASSRFARDPALLQKLKGKHIRILPDADESGLKAAAIWFHELTVAGLSVDVKALPSGCKDLAPLVADSGYEQHLATLHDLFATG